MEQQFEDAMAAMAADPAIQQVPAELLEAFRVAEEDSLPPTASMPLCFAITL
jgi:hypothetical protein